MDVADPMPNKVIKIGLLAFATFAFFVVFLTCCGEFDRFCNSDWDAPTNGIYLMQLRIELEEQLPDRSTLEQAKAWLASRDFKGWRFGNATSDDKRVAICLSVVIPNDSFRYKAEIRIELLFNSNGQLLYRLSNRVEYAF